MISNLHIVCWCVCSEHTSAGVCGEAEAGLGGIPEGAVSAEGGGGWGAC